MPFSPPWLQEPYSDWIAELICLHSVYDKLLGRVMQRLEKNFPAIAYPV
jgi:hypothetical protein